MEDNTIRCVIVIGGGLVGSLCACFMAKRGYQVHLYEKRNDIRTSVQVQGRSINLALSHRGLKALRYVGLEEEVLRAAVSMKGRRLHGLHGETKSVAYDTVNNQCINSVGRNFLNKALLNAAEKYPNIELNFNHKLIDCNFDQGALTIKNLITNGSTIVKADLIIGADGAFSVLRRLMQHTPLFQFSQTYIEHGYLEFVIPPSRSSLLTPNHLHIWPRGKFMMIALPNFDNSWTVTLFMPFEKFNSLNFSSEILTFFTQTFPDSINLIGQEELVRNFLKTKPSSLVSIKCSPYHVGDRFLIIGDAAHAMVPFYGQGMNAGFEDCTILNEILNKNHDNISKSIKEFSERRKEDAHTICDLALYNYREMRDLVTTPSYRLRKVLDDLLSKLLPNTWRPLYNSVTFSNMSYKECLENRRWQDKVICRGLMAILSIAVLFSCFCYKVKWGNCDIVFH